MVYTHTHTHTHLYYNFITRFYQRLSLCEPESPQLWKISRSITKNKWNFLRTIISDILSQGVRACLYYFAVYLTTLLQVQIFLASNKRFYGQILILNYERSVKKSTLLWMSLQHVDQSNISQIWNISSFINHLRWTESYDCICSLI